MNHLVADIADRFNLTRRAGRWVGPCPKCGGSKSSDKFVIRDDGGFKCYGCPFKGKLEKFLREVDGKSCPEAYEATGNRCDYTSCSVRGSCRMGDGSHKPRQRQTRPAVPVAAEPRPALSSSCPVDPQGPWLTWAVEFTEQSAKALQENAAALDWLQARGIDEAAARRFRLGWNRTSLQVPRVRLGLEPKDDKETLWIPAGLVIPTWNAAGTLHRLRIRRPDADRERFLPDLKYVWIEGSGTGSLVIVPEHSRGVIIVEAELDAYACAAAHDQVTLVALGTVSAGISPEIRRLLEAAPVILVALDADHSRNGKAGAGPAAVQAWLAEWRQAHYWPVPAGKDPGDYVRDHGGNLRQWLEAGPFPPVVTSRPPAPAHADEPIPLQHQDRGEGVVLLGNAPSAPWPPVDPDARPWIDERGCLVIPFNSPVKYRWWQQGGQSVMETLKELFEERAAIMEHDGGLSREEAEQEAARIMARYEPHF